jgi:hypothetical protein
MSITFRTPSRRSTTVAVVGVLAAALSLGSARLVWPESSGTGAVDSASSAWFEPIAKYYGDNPKVTPSFRFADLYTADPVWFGPIAEYYHFAPGITSARDFAALYGPTGVGSTP